MRNADCRFRALLHGSVKPGILLASWSGIGGLAGIAGKRSTPFFLAIQAGGSDIRRPRTFVQWRVYFINFRFEISGLFDQDRSKPGVRGRAGEFEKRCRLTHEISSTDHDATPVFHPARYITQQAGIRSAEMYKSEGYGNSIALQVPWRELCSA